MIGYSFGTNTKGFNLKLLTRQNIVDLEIWEVAIIGYAPTRPFFSKSIIHVPCNFINRIRSWSIVKITCYHIRYFALLDMVVKQIYLFTPFDESILQATTDSSSG